MKRSNILTMALTALIGLGLASCDLERLPKQSLSRETAMDTYNDAIAWRNGMLASFRGRVGGTYYLFQDIQADELITTKNYGNTYGALIDWVNLLSTTYDTRDIYAGYYGALKNVNHVIAEMPKLAAKLSDNQKKNVERFIGEAHFFRAYYYLNLAIRYGKSYKEASATKDLSVPLHLKFDFQAKLPRSTNKEVYDQILKDIAEAETRLATIAGAVASPSVTIDVVKALKSRTYLYMERWSDALATAKELTGSATYKLMDPSVDNMKKMWQGDSEGLKEDLMLPVVSFPDEGNPTLNVYLRANAKSVFFQPYFLPSKASIDLFTPQDTRRDVYFLEGETTSVSGKEYTDLVLVNKWRGNPKLAATDHTKWGKVPDSRMRPKPFRLAEQYLIVAEAAYRAGNTAEATQHLNALLQSRGLSAVTVSGDALFQEIAKERQRELFLEGYRLFDLRRWNLGVVRDKPQVSKTSQDFLVVNLSKGFVIQANDHRFVWPIPRQDTQVNPKIIQNPGY